MAEARAEEKAAHAPRGVRVLLALLLLSGTVLFGIGAALHPHLTGSSEAQLAMISGTQHWRGIHLALVSGSVLVMCGGWSYFLRERPFAAPGVVVMALVLFTVGHAINALNTIYMTGAGATIAELNAAGTPGMAALYSATHPFGLVAARAGNFIVAISALLLGWVGTRPGEPRWLGMLAWISGVAGLVAVLSLREDNPLILLPVALLCLWQVGVVLLVLREPHGNY
ncbi:MAG: hypothetical protein ABJD11_13960 [Gemmatimonadota bacterium]